MWQVGGDDARQASDAQAEADDWPPSQSVDEAHGYQIGRYLDDARDEQHQVRVADQRTRVQRQPVVDQAVGEPVT